MESACGARVKRLGERLERRREAQTSRDSDSRALGVNEMRHEMRGEMKLAAAEGICAIYGLQIGLQSSVSFETGRRFTWQLTTGQRASSRRLSNLEPVARSVVVAFREANHKSKARGAKEGLPKRRASMIISHTTTNLQLSTLMSSNSAGWLAFGWHTPNTKHQLALTDSLTN